ncbi:MAG: hypothetical protein Tsb0010_16280 [Parvularculaceae bacterium]
MKLEKINAYLGVVTHIGVVIGLILVILELRQNSRDLQAQIELSMADSYQTILGRSIEHKEFADLIIKGAMAPDEITMAERLRLTSWQAEQLVVLFATYQLYDKGIVEEDVWAMHARGFGYFMSVPLFRELYFNDNQGVQSEAFYAALEEAGGFDENSGPTHEAD